MPVEARNDAIGTCCAVFAIAFCVSNDDTAFQSSSPTVGGRVEAKTPRKRAGPAAKRTFIDFSIGRDVIVVHVNDAVRKREFRENMRDCSAAFASNSDSLGAASSAENLIETTSIRYGHTTKFYFLFIFLFIYFSYVHKSFCLALA